MALRRKRPRSACGEIEPLFERQDPTVRGRRSDRSVRSTASQRRGRSALRSNMIPSVQRVLAARSVMNAPSQNAILKAARRTARKSPLPSTTRPWDEIKQNACPARPVEWLNSAGQHWDFRRQIDNTLRIPVAGQHGTKMANHSAVMKSLSRNEVF